MHSEPPSQRPAKTFSLAVTALSFVIALASCREIRFNDGEVPEELVPVAERYLGTYRGTIDGANAEFRIFLAGPKLMLVYASERGGDLVNPWCGSQIGQLQSVRVTSRKQEPLLQRATFAFDPNRCADQVPGRELQLDFTEQNPLRSSPAGDGKIRFDVSLAREQVWVNECRIDPGNPSAGQRPREICGPHAVTRHLTGRFHKVPGSEFLAPRLF